MSVRALPGMVQLRLMCTPWIDLMSAHKDFPPYQSDALLDLFQLISDIVYNARLPIQINLFGSVSTCFVPAHVNMRLRDITIRSCFFYLLRTAGPQGRLSA